jgi:hypothetical protein
LHTVLAIGTEIILVQLYHPNPADLHLYLLHFNGDSGLTDVIPFYLFILLLFGSYLLLETIFGPSMLNINKKLLPHEQSQFVLFGEWSKYVKFIPMWKLR